MKYVAIGENHLYSKAYAKGKKHVGRLAAVYVLPDLAARKLQKAHPQKIKMNRIGLTVSKKIGGGSAKYFIRQQKLLGALNGQVEEMVSGYRTVVAYNHQSRPHNRYMRIINHKLPNWIAILDYQPFDTSREREG